MRGAAEAAKDGVTREGRQEKSSILQDLGLLMKTRLQILKEVC